METSPVTINNFFTTINITIFAVGGAVGIIGTLVTKFGSKFIDEYFRYREVRREKKRKLARDVIEICTEGSSAGHNVMPGSQRHILFLAAQIEGQDKTVAEDLRKYLGLWVVCAMKQQHNKSLSKEDVEFCISLARQATVLEDSILERIRKWE